MSSNKLEAAAKFSAVEVCVVGLGVDARTSYPHVYRIVIVLQCVIQPWCRLAAQIPGPGSHNWEALNCR